MGFEGETYAYRDSVRLENGSPPTLAVATSWYWTKKQVGQEPRPSLLNLVAGLAWAMAIRR